MNTRLYKHIFFSIIFGSFTYASQAMEHNSSIKSFDKEFGEFTRTTIDNIYTKQTINEKILYAMDDCLKKIYLPNTKGKEKSTIVIGYTKLPLSITARIQYDSNHELEETIGKIIKPFIFMGWLIHRGHPGTSFIPGLSQVILRNMGNLLAPLPKPLQNSLIELMIINTQILLNVPFELLNTSRGINILKKSNFGKQFAQFCAFEVQLAQSVCSLDTLKFDDEKPKEYINPFIQIYNQISHKMNDNYEAFSFMKLNENYLKLELLQDELKTKEQVIFELNKRLGKYQLSQITACLKNLKTNLLSAE